MAEVREFVRIIRIIIVVPISLSLILSACSSSTLSSTETQSYTTTEQHVQTESSSTEAVTTKTATTSPVYTIDKNGFTIYENTQPPFSTSFNTPVFLVNNSSAINPTWDSLMTFINSDPTDTMPYVESFVVCSRFAETLHNNAEKAGIRASWVYIGLSFYKDGHACNAFMTTDKGLVFVDCTGGKLSFISVGEFSIDNDRIAYVNIGEDYGLISVGVALSPEYSYYAEYTNNSKEYLIKFEKYNLERQRYIDELGGRTQLSEPEYSYFLSWYNKLNDEKSRLEEMLSVIGHWTWESLGKVEEVKIFL